MLITLLREYGHSHKILRNDGISHVVAILPNDRAGTGEMWAHQYFERSVGVATIVVRQHLSPRAGRKRKIVKPEI